MAEVSTETRPHHTFADVCISSPTDEHMGYLMYARPMTTETTP